MSALQDEPPAPGAATPDMPGGLGMRALRNTILILVVRVISRIIALDCGDHHRQLPRSHPVR